MKKILSLLLSISMLCTLFTTFPTAVSAATSGTCGDNLTWSFSNGTLTISGSGAMYDYSYPDDNDEEFDESDYVFPPWESLRSSINLIDIEEDVTTVGNSAFFSCYNATRITLPNSITKIGSQAFYNCDSLTSITVPSNTSHIEASAFDLCTNLTYIIIDSANQTYCSLNGIVFNKSKTTLVKYPAGRSETSYEIPQSITIIGDSAFRFCENLTSMNIPETVTSIGAFAFENCCEMTDIYVPDTVTSIGERAFSWCSSLTSINVPNGITNIAAGTFEGCYSLADISIPSGVTNIGDRAFFYCGALKNVTLPRSVKSIGKSAFADCSELLGIGISLSGVQTIGDAAFRYCSKLSNVDIPYTVTHIGSLVFEGCETLNLITVDDANQNYCAIDGVLFDKNITYLHTYPMSKYGESYIVPDGVTDVGTGAFSGCINLRSINLPDTVSNIGISAFRECVNLTDINVPDGVTAIKAGTFERCVSISCLDLPDGITSIGQNAFSDCGTLEDFSIPNSVKYIGAYAFRGCGNLVSVEIPNGISIIYDGCFSECGSLTDVVLPDTVTNIGEFAFAWCYSLTNINMPKALKTIGENSFDTCQSLETMTIPDTVVSIGDYAFEYCKSLKNINIPRYVTKVANNTFRNCTALEAITVDNENKYYTSVDGILFNKAKIAIIKYPPSKKGNSYIIPSTVKRIGTSAFENCDKLTDVTMPNSVTMIGESAFINCSYLENINISENVTSITPYAFAYCDALSSIIIPEGVTTITFDAFYSCDSLQDVTIPKTLKKIENSAFSSCPNLADVYYSGDKTSWDEIKIGNWNTDLTNAQLHYITPTEDLPIIVLPGIMGSTLKDATGGLGVPVLTANSDFIPQNKLVIADTLAANTGASDLIEMLEGVGDHMVYPCPYDWRLSLEDISEKYLKPLIEDAKKSTGKDKVILVGHSMGGLVARTYIQSDDYDFDVDSLYMIGTPNQGSTAMIPLAEHGVPYDGAQATVMAYNYNKMTGEDFNKATQKEVRSFINKKVVSTRQLLPSYSSYYYDVETFTRKGSGLNDYLKELNENALSCGRYQTMAGMNKNKVRTILFASEEELDTPQALKAVYNGIYPVLEYTPPFMKNKASYMTNVVTNSSPYVESTVSAGDGTVLTYSATVSSKFKNIWTIDSGDYGKHMGMFGGLAKSIATYLEIMPQMMSLSSAETETTEANTLESLQIDVSGADATIYINSEAAYLENGRFYSDDIQNGEYVIECTKSADSNRITVQLLYTNNGETSQKLISFLNDANSISFKIADGVLDFENKTVSHLQSINNNGYANLMWDANENAKSYKIYAKNFSDSTYSLLDETEEAEYLTNDVWLDDFSEDCVCYYVIPILKDETEGGYSEGARNYNTAQAAFDYIVNEEEKTVSFTDLSTGDISSWEWDFDGDRTIDSTEQNPTYTYTNDGVYDVTLTISGASGTSVMTCNDAVKIGVYPKELIVESETENIKVGESTSLSAYILMSDESQKEVENITFVSGNDSILSINENIVTANTIGSTNITASANGLVKNIEISSITDEVTITLSTDGYGFAEGSGNYQLGETILISAISIDNEEFLGWYKGDELISTDKDFWFEVTEAVDFTAKFTKNNTSYVNAKVDYCGYDSNELYAYITYNYVFDDCTAFIAIYDKDGRLQELDSQFVEKNSAYTEFCIPSTSDLKGYDFKVFFWQNTTSLKPVSVALKGTVE